MPADLVTRLLLQNEQFDRNIKESRAQLQAFNKRIEAASASVKTFVGGFAGMAGISFAFMDVVQKSMQFEKSLSSLKSLTGLSAKDMEFFKQKAIELGSTSTQTASQVVEAFQLIGSQQPELLKNKDALAEVTKQAIILAEAAGMDVPDAAKALSGSINQMGESADVAGEYINILAAASQAGSADIQYLSKAIEKSGGAASSVGIKYNELVAAIEAIAPKITEASEAGTNLRNIFLTLESSSDKNLKPSVVGLTTALENLAAKNLDATQMTKMFGKESVTAALAIVNAKDDYKDYIEAITGTNTALEQQKINNDNLYGSLNNISSAWEGFVLTLNNSNGQLKETADYITAILGQITEFIKSDQQKQTSLIAEGVKDRKKELDKEIEGWMVLGDRRKAIQETIRQFELRNPEGGNILGNLNAEKNKLEQLQSSLRKLKEKQKEGGSFVDIVGKQLTGLPNISTSYADVFNKENIEEQIASQQELVNKLEIKNELYKQSIQYLNDELKATDQINKKTKEPTKIVVTDEMRKQWKKESLKLKAEYEIESSLEDSMRAEKAITKNAADSYKITTPFHIEFFADVKDYEEELPDIKGSIADYEQQIQNLTIAYNEETNSTLRSVYAKRIQDLEETVKKMKDINEGMIDISNAVNSLIQGSIVSGFESLGEALSAGDPTEAFRNILSALMDQLKQFGAALVAAGTAKLAFDKLFMNPIAAIAAGGALIIAASAAKSALQKAVPMANGGVVYGETFARVAEYPGAASNPEVIAPLNKLRDIINVGDYGSQEIRITGKLVGHGSDLVAVVDNYSRKQGRIK